MTPTARYADIVLPATTFWERNDVHTPWAGAGHYAIFMQQAIAPVGECRNDLDICAELAGRLGIAGYNDKTEDEWLRELTRARHRRLRDVPGQRPGPAARPRRRGGVRAGDPRSGAPPVHDAVGQDRDLLDGASRPTPIPTASARSRRSRPGSRRRRSTRATRCGWSRPSRAPARTRSTTTSRSSSRADREDVWIHPADAAAAASRTAQRVRVFNERGRTLLPARVTDRMAPGVVSIKEGAWFAPDARRAGHARLLERADRRPLVARRRDALQHLLRGDRSRPPSRRLSRPSRRDQRAGGRGWSSRAPPARTRSWAGSPGPEGQRVHPGPGVDRRGLQIVGHADRHAVEAHLAHSTAAR